jgi:hypothetical protein
MEKIPVICLCALLATVVAAPCGFAYTAAQANTTTMAMADPSLEGVPQSIATNGGMFPPQVANAGGYPHMAPAGGPKRISKCKAPVAAACPPPMCGPPVCGPAGCAPPVCGPIMCGPMVKRPVMWY